MRKILTTQSQVDAQAAPGYFRVAKGLYLAVRKHGSKSWLFRYQRGGRAHWAGCGAADVVTLAKARAKALAFRVMLAEGRDPLAEKRQASNAQAVAAPTFEACAAEYIETHRAGWKNEKHAAQWAATLKTYAAPVIGKMPVSDVAVSHVVEILRTIWESKAETAGRLRGRIELILSMATARGWRNGANPAAWETLKHTLAPHKRVKVVEHHAAVPVAEVPALIRELQAKDSISAKALLFTALTAARTNETLGATWPEIDLRAKVWEIPAARMKMKRAHRVPLSNAVVGLLQGLPGGEGFIFPGGRAGKPLSNMALLEMIRGLRGKGATVHGLRSSFRDWCSENGFSRELAESALAHALPSKVEAAYLRTDLLEARRPMMAAWGDYAMGKPKMIKISLLSKAKV